MAAAAWADCPSPTAHVDAAQQAVLEARLDDAASQLAAAEGAFGCDMAASPEVLARMWIAEGAMLVFEGDPDAAAESFAGAKRVSADTWVDDYGSKLKAAWQAAPELAGGGTVTLEPAAHAEIGFLNGKLTPFPSEVQSGLHLVQVIPDGQAQFATVVYVGDGDVLNVPTGLPADLAPLAVVADISPQPLPTDPPPARGSATPVFLIAGAGVGVLALGTAGGALLQNGAMKRADTVEQLDGIFRTQKALAYSTGALAVVSSAGIGLHFAL